MTLATLSKGVGLDDCQIFKVTADTSATYTCDSAIDVFGVKTLKVTPTVDAITLTGDNKDVDMWAKTIGGTFELTCCKEDLARLAMVTGGSLVAAGSTPNQKQTLSMLASNQANAFQLQGLILGTDVDSAIRSARVVLFKCKIDGYELINAEERKEATYSVKGKCFYTNKTFARATTESILYEYIFDETAATLTAITS